MDLLVVSSQKGIHHNPQECVRAPRNGKHLGEGDPIRGHQKDGIRHIRGPLSPQYNHMLVSASLPELPDHSGVMDQAKLVQPCPKFIAVVETKTQGQGHIQESWCCYSDDVDPKVVGGIV